MMLILLIVLSFVIYTSGGAFEPVQVMCEINGQLVPAMIDTGAEITVMSSSCAKRCRVHTLIDTQHSGKAIGVGFSEIVGGIEGLGMRIGPLNFQTKVSILRNSRCDFLIGLDVLERFKCEISLKDKILKLNVRGDEVRIPLTSSRTSPSTKHYEYSNLCGGSTKSNHRSAFSWKLKRGTSLEEDESKFQEARKSFQKLKFGSVLREPSELNETMPSENEKDEIENDFDQDANEFEEDDDTYVLDDSNVSLEGV